MPRLPLLTIAALLLVGAAPPAATAQARTSARVRRIVIHARPAPPAMPARGRLVRRREGTIRRPPPGARHLRVHGLSYLYHDGTFLRRDRDRYRIVVAPIGAIVASRPRGSVTVSVRGAVYTYAQGTFYRWNEAAGAYEVVAAPTGAVVGKLPPGASPTHSRDGEPTIWMAGTVRYRAARRNGARVFVVMGPTPAAGAGSR